MATETELNAQWRSLSLMEKRVLMGKHQWPKHMLVADVWKHICTFLGRDPRAFYALIATCREVRNAVGDDFYPYADKTCFDIWIERLERICASHRMRIKIENIPGMGYALSECRPRVDKIEIRLAILMPRDGYLWMESWIQCSNASRFIHARDVWSFFSGPHGGYCHCPDRDSQERARRDAMRLQHPEIMCERCATKRYEERQWLERIVSAHVKKQGYQPPWQRPRLDFFQRSTVLCGDCERMRNDEFRQVGRLNNASYQSHWKRPRLE